MRPTQPPPGCRDPATEPGLPRFLLGPGQAGAGGPAEGGGEPDPVPENRKQGERNTQHAIQQSL